jgi:hypothetical protein
VINPRIFAYSVLNSCLYKFSFLDFVVDFVVNDFDVGGVGVVSDLLSNVSETEAIVVGMRGDTIVVDKVVDPLALAEFGFAMVVVVGFDALSEVFLTYCMFVHLAIASPMVHCWCSELRAGLSFSFVPLKNFHFPYFHFPLLSECHFQILVCYFHFQLF